MGTWGGSWGAAWGTSWNRVPAAVSTVTPQGDRNIAVLVRETGVSREAVGAIKRRRITTAQ